MLNKQVQILTLRMEKLEKVKINKRLPYSTRKAMLYRDLADNGFLRDTLGNVVKGDYRYLIMSTVIHYQRRNPNGTWVTIRKHNPKKIHKYLVDMADKGANGLADYCAKYKKPYKQDPAAEGDIYWAGGMPIY